MKTLSKISRKTKHGVLVCAGHSLPMIGRLLGHSKPETTARYAHLDLETLRKVTNSAGKAIAS